MSKKAYVNIVSICSILYSELASLIRDAPNTKEILVIRKCQWKTLHRGSFYERFVGIVTSFVKKLVWTVFLMFKK